ncbi:MAG: hypothetical protein K0S86_2732 [Geminicoccaceae bacterium]|nr:hypothetical protein [Geminicoccaceae bacterium]
MINRTPWSSERYVRAGLIGLLVAFTVVASFVRQPAITTGEDDAEYVLLSRSLREGHYRDVADVSRAFHTRYPPAYPAALAVVAMVAGERVGVMTLVGIGWAIMTIVLLFAIARRYVGESTALLACALLALNPWFLTGAGRLMSEAQFTALTVLTIWAGLGEPRTAGRDALAGAAAILAALTRLAGVPLVAALLVDWLLRRRLRSAVALVVVSMLSIGSWLWFAAASPEQFLGTSYIADAATIVDGPDPTSARPVTEVTAPSLVAAIASRAYRNARGYVTTLLPYRLGVPTIRRAVVDNVAWSVAVITLLAIGLAGLWKHSRLLVLFMAAYGALLVVWTWRIDRFLDPVIPFILFGMVLGCTMLRRTRWPWLQYATLVPLATLIGASNVQLNAATIRRAADCDRRQPTVSPACFGGVDRAFFAAAHYADSTTSASAVFLTPKQRVFHYYSDRRIFPYRRALALSPPRMIDSLRATGAEHVLVAPLGPVQIPYRARLQAVCERLAVERQFDSNTILFRILRDGEPGDTRACELLKTVRATR